MAHKSSTHSGKSESYDKGRPEYPAEFFVFLSDEYGLNKGSSIADIGCGTGKVTKNFLQRGSKVFAVEPDGDMLRIADRNLKQYPNYVSYQKTAEDTGIETDSVDCIFCGNAYHWFDRKLVAPEFKRISRSNGIVVIATLGGGGNPYDGELWKLYTKSVVVTKPNESLPFESGTYVEKIFLYTVCETYDEFLHGSLSSSAAPSAADAAYRSFCEDIEALFNKYSRDGKLEMNMRLHCMIGSASDLTV